MENYLAMKNLSDCIVAKDDDVNVAKEANADKLKQAKAILCLSLEPNLFPHVRKCVSALSVWKKIQELFEDRGHLRRANLFEKLVLNRLENCDSMATYIANIMTSVSKLGNIGLEISDNLSITLALMGLGQDYKPFVMGLGSNMNIKFDELKMRLLEMDEGSTSGNAMISKAKNNSKDKKPRKKKQRRCFKCNSTTHLQNQCPENKTSEANANVGSATMRFLYSKRQ